jgi:hypothetical protein
MTARSLRLVAGLLYRRHSLRVEGGLQGLDDDFAEGMEAEFANVRRRQLRLGRYGLEGVGGSI